MENQRVEKHSRNGSSQNTAMIHAGVSEEPKIFTSQSTH